MGKIVIVVDSIACVPREEMERHGMKMVPVNIFFNGKVYRDQIDLTAEQAYELLAKAPDFWKSSAASPEEYLRVFQEVSSYADGVVVVTLSSKLSMFYTSALLAKNIIAEKMPGLKIEVVDSRTAAAAEGLIALAAARAAEQGKSFKEVVEVAEKVKEKVRFIGLLETIRYVYRTGRVPKVASELGSVLAVKPLLVSSDGAIHFAGMARSRQSGIERMLKMMKDGLEGSRAVHAAVMHAASPEEAEKLKERIGKEFNCVELFVTDFSPVMGYATGKGTLALAYYGED